MLARKNCNSINAIKQDFTEQMNCLDIAPKCGNCRLRNRNKAVEKLLFVVLICIA